MMKKQALDIAAILDAPIDDRMMQMEYNHNRTLHLAAARGEVIEGVTLNSSQNEWQRKRSGSTRGGQTVMHLAVVNGNIDIAIKMFSQQHTIRWNGDGHTALHLAIEMGSVNMVQVILGGKQCDEYLSTRTAQGKTPLEFASNIMLHKKTEPFMRKRMSHIIYLINLVIDDDNASSVDSELRTVLHHAVGTLDSAETIRRVINKGINIDAVDCNGRTALHYCLMRDVQDINGAKVLVYFGADPDIKDIDGITARKLAPKTFKFN